MAKLATNILSTAKVGKYSDGGGLYLLVKGHDGKGRAKGSWIFRYTFLKQRYELGLGSVQSLSLAQARIERDRWRDLMTDKRNPINPMDDKRRLETDAQHGRNALTLADVAPDHPPVAARLVGIFISARVFHSPHERHCPSHLEVSLPQEPQTNTVFDFGCLGISRIRSFNHKQRPGD